VTTKKHIQIHHPEITHTLPTRELSARRVRKALAVPTYKRPFTKEFIPASGHKHSHTA